MGIDGVGSSTQRRRFFAGATLLGAISGVLSGLLGVGGGLIMVPGMVLGLKRRQHVAHATSLAAIIPISLAGVLAFGKANAVDWKMGGLLALGSVPSARLGANLMRRVPADQLRRVFGCFVIAVAIWLLVSR